MSERKEWRPVKGFEGRYEVSEFGDVRSLLCKDGIRSNPRELKHCKTDRGYHYVSLCSGSTKHKSRRIHQLVAEAFLENPKLLESIDHLDRNKSNNHYSNLEWCTTQENVERAIAKKYRATSPSGDVVEFFNLSSFARSVGVSVSGLSEVVRGKKRICKGWTAAAPSPDDSP